MHFVWKKLVTKRGRKKKKRRRNREKERKRNREKRERRILRVFLPGKYEAK